MLNCAFGLQLRNGILVDVDGKCKKSFRVHILDYLQHSLLIDLSIENMTQVAILHDGGSLINFREIFFRRLKDVLLFCFEHDI